MTDLSLTQIAHDPVPGRSCASIGCAMCCKLPSINEPELQKPVNEWCPHAEPKQAACGGACSIYDSRPESCRGFMCVWLYTDWWPEELSPPRTGCYVVFSNDTLLEGGFEIPTIRVHEARPGASQELNEILCRFWGGGCPIVIYKPNNRVECIGFRADRSRVSLFDRESNAAIGTVRLPIVTIETVARLGGFERTRQHIRDTWEQGEKDIP